MPDRKPLVAVAAAAVVTVAVTALVVAFGIRRLPEVPAVSDPPALAPPGTIAYVSAEGEEAEQCVHVVPAAGGQDVVALCSGDDTKIDWIDEIAWTPTGDLVVTGTAHLGDQVVHVVDIVADEPRGSRTFARP